ncbi:tetratricopeptide repeat protein [bacterium]|nr:tetratricopeptide repeat protein [bacterium]
MISESWESLLQTDFDKLAGIVSESKVEKITLREGEKRVVSILFLDLHGFTKISEKLDPEEVRNIVDNTFKIFSKIIQNYNGYIDKYEGDLIMALFGSKKSSEHDTEKALYTAIELFEMLEKINGFLAQKGLKIEMRVGVNTGEVITGKVGIEREGDFTVYGDAVNVASRMESNAEINTILVPETVKLLVGEKFEFKDLGEILVKGKEEPIKVFRVLGKSEKYFDSWNRQKNASFNFVFVGREKQTKQLENFCQHLVQKSFSEEKIPSILIKGEAGSGKSRFMHEFINRNKQYTYQRIQKNFSFIKEQHGVVLNILKKIFSISDYDSKEIRQEKIDVTLKELLDYNAKIFETQKMVYYLFNVEPFKNLEPEEIASTIKFITIKIILASAKHQFFKEKKSVVWVFDDIHNLHSTSIDFLKALLEEEKFNIPLGIILSARDDEPNSNEILGNFQTETITCELLTEFEITKMLRGILNFYELPKKIRNQIIEKSYGNPYFIEEIIHALIENKILSLRKGKWEFLKKYEEYEIPKTLNALILSRVDNLPVSLRDILQRASVIGYKCPVRVLRAIYESLGEWLDPGKLDFLISSGYLESLVEKDEKFLKFKNDLIRKVSYGILLNFNKKILHNLVGESIEEFYSKSIDDFTYDLSEHFFVGENEMKSKHYIKKAIIKSLEVYDLEKATKLLTNFLSLKNTSTEILWAKQNLGIIRFSVGEGENVLAEFREILKDEIFTSSPIENQCDFLNNIAEIKTKLGQFDIETKNYLQKVLENEDKISNIEIKGNTYRLLTILNRNTGNYEDAINFAETSVKFFQKSDNKLGEGKAYGNLGNVYWQTGKYEKAYKSYAATLKIMRKIGNKDAEIIALSNLGSVLKKTNKVKESIKLQKIALKKAIEIGDKVREATSLMTIAEFYLTIDNEIAMNCLEKALPLLKKFQMQKELARLKINQAIIYKREGNFEKAIKYLNESLEICQQNNLKILEAIVYENLGENYLSIRNFKTSIDFYEKCITIYKLINNEPGIKRVTGYKNQVHSTMENKGE